MWIKIAVCDKEMLFSISEGKPMHSQPSGNMLKRHFGFDFFNIPFTVCYFSLEGFPGKKQKTKLKGKIV